MAVGDQAFNTQLDALLDAQQATQPIDWGDGSWAQVSSFVTPPTGSIDFSNIVGAVKDFWHGTSLVQKSPNAIDPEAFIERAAVAVRSGVSRVAADAGSAAAQAGGDTLRKVLPYAIIGGGLFFALEALKPSGRRR